MLIKKAQMSAVKMSITFPEDVIELLKKHADLKNG